LPGRSQRPATEQATCCLRGLWLGPNRNVISVGRTDLAQGPAVDLLAGTLLTRQP